MMLPLNRDETGSKMLYVYTFKKGGKLSFKQLESEKENTTNSTLETSGNERTITPGDGSPAFQLLGICLCDWP